MNRWYLLFAGATALAGLTASMPARAQQFDGQWKMQFSTNSSNPVCRQFGSMTVTIKDSRASGRLYHPQVGQFDLRAAVADDGGVKDGIMQGISTVAVAGKLESASGKGIWTNPTCSGEWSLTK